MKYDYIFFDSGGTLYQAGIKGPNSPSALHEQRAARIFPLITYYGYQDNLENFKSALLRAEAKFEKKHETYLFNYTFILSYLMDDLKLSITKEISHILTDLYAGPRMANWLFSNTLSVLTELKNNGAVLGIIANTEWPGFCMDRAFDALSLLPLFTHRIYSGDCHLKKPDAKIFDYAARITGNPNKRFLYIGNDEEKDIIPAKKLGWSTALRLANKTASPQSEADLKFYESSDLLKFCL